MKRRFCLSVLALFCSVLSGCDFFVTENSDPYTADEVAAMVNGKFHAYGAQTLQANPGHSSGEKDAALLEERLAQYFEVRLKAAKAHVRDYRK